MRTKLERLALIGLSKGGTTLPEEKAQTRHSELESTEVLLIRAYQRDTLKHGTWVTLLNGERLWVPQNGRSLPKKWPSPRPRPENPRFLISGDWSGFDGRLDAVLVRGSQSGRRKWYAAASLMLHGAHETINPGTGLRWFQ